MTKLTKEQSDHIIAKVSGVQAGDTKVQAAEKVIATMKAAGYPTRKAERMLAQLKALEKHRDN